MKNNTSKISCKRGFAQVTDYLSLEGEGGTQCRVRGKVNKENLICTPSSVLRTSSPSRGKETTWGFTLIELLVVVLIIGILAAVALPQYQRAVLKSRATQLFTLAKHFKDVCTVDVLAGGTCAKLQDIGFEYEVSDYTYDESSSLETGTINGFRIEHAKYFFSGYDTQSKLVIMVSNSAAKNGIYCVALEHASDIEKVCESMGGQEEPYYANFNPNTYYRL